MKSILLVRRAYGLGGAELYNLNLALELRELGYNPIICTQQPELAQLAKDNSISVINPLWLRNQGRLTGPFGLRTWAKYLLAAPIIIIQYLYYILRYNIVGMLIQTRDDQIFGTIAAKLLGRRAVWADHGDFKIVLTTKDGGFQRVYLWALGKSEAAICVANSERALAVKHLPKRLHSKMIVIHNGVSRQRFEIEPINPSTHRLVVGSTARVQPEKGVDYLIRAFAEALPELPKDSQLLLAGVIDAPEFVELAKNLGVGEQTQFLGGIPSTEVPDFLAKLDLYVFPSLGEVFPLSILEAMMASRPVIATDVGGVSEVVDGKTGLLVPAADTAALSHAIIQLANITARQKLAKAGHDRVYEQNDFKRIVATEILPLLTGGPHD